MRNQILALLHPAHSGIVKMKLAARQAVFWPGLTTDIESFVANCYPCQKSQPSNSKGPLQL